MWSESFAKYCQNRLFSWGIFGGLCSVHALPYSPNCVILLNKLHWPTEICTDMSPSPYPLCKRPPEILGEKFVKKLVDFGGHISKTGAKFQKPDDKKLESFLLCST